MECSKECETSQFRENSETSESSDSSENSVTRENMYYCEFQVSDPLLILIQ